jgi:hypothetical protein
LIMRRVIADGLLLPSRQWRVLSSGCRDNLRLCRWWRLRRRVVAVVGGYLLSGPLPLLHL